MSAFVWILSLGLVATTIAEKSEEEFLKQAKILCAIQLETPSRAFLRGDQVFTQAKFNTIQCFKGTLPTKARLEWIGGTATKMHENAEEKITTRVPGLIPPAEKEAFIGSFEKKEDDIYVLEDWNHRYPLQKTSGDEYQIEKVKDGKAFLNLKEIEESKTTKSLKSFRPQKTIISLDEFKEQLSKTLEE